MPVSICNYPDFFPVPSHIVNAYRFVLDPYRGQGTVYLHLNKGGDRVHSKGRENPTGAVVVPISLATTFQQAVPGQATATDDPNSFGLGYEYSRTGMFWSIVGFKP